MKTARDGKGTEGGGKKEGKGRRGNGIGGICVIVLGGIDARGAVGKVWNAGK